MIFYAGLIFLIFAVSLDGFGVGIAYGMRHIRVPLGALLIIMLCSGGIVLLSMTIGSMLSSSITPAMAKVIGGFILISVGLYCFYHIRQSKKNGESFDKKEPIVENMQKDHDRKSKNLNMINIVLKKPEHADLDASGSISAKEALLLGIALALDAFGAGLGAAMLGYAPLLTAFLIAVMCGFFVYSGMKIGMMMSKNRWMKKMTFLPPLLLIAIGVSNLLR